MGLVNIPNQPLRFMSYEEMKACQKNESYCAKYQPLDPLMAQWRQTPCGAELVCDPYFTDEGPELVTNGSFAADTDWTHSGSWTLGGGQACFAAVAGSKVLSQSLTLTVGAIYRIAFTLENYVANTLNVAFTGASAGDYTADGTYTVTMTATATNDLIAFSSADSFDGCITGVSVVELSSCWEFDNSEITFNGPPDGGICHIVGTQTIATLSTPPLTAPNYYKVTVVIAGRSDGDVTVTLGVSGPTSEAVLNTNGINVVYLYADTTGDVTITMSSDFNGCISAVSIFELVSDYTIVIKDADGNPVPSNIQTYAFYESDFITLPVGAISAIELSGGGNLSYGCYTIEITDPCDNTAYESNCISYQAEHPNTNLLQGRLFTGKEGYAFGFKFNPFLLSQRLEFYFTAPKYPAKFDSKYYSTGQYYQPYATSEKVFEMLFAAVGEIEHDAIRLQLLCPDFSVMNSASVTTYYYNKSEEYAPEYDKGRVKKLCESRVQVQKRTDVLKLSNV